LFLAFALAAQGSVQASPLIWISSLVALSAAAFCILLPASPPASFSPVASLVVVFAVWMVIANKWTNPSYTAAAPYHGAFLLGGFFLGRRAGIENAGRLFRVALAFAICLAAWGILQRTEGELRAHALFETPATLTATINLLLLPALVLVVCAKRSAWLTVVSVFLVAAICAGMSRGGWLGLVAGGCLAYLFGRRAGLTIQRDAAVKLIVVFTAGWALSWLVPILMGAVPNRQLYSIAGDAAAQSSVARLELYELAWRATSTSSLLTGIGYLGYYYVMEAARSGIASYERSITYFVHNDYLQSLLELGLPGLASLIGITAWPLISAWRAAPRILESRSRLALVALVAALGSMAAHAMVDFPFYVPICLLIYGTALGVLDSILLAAQPARQTRPNGTRTGVQLGRIAISGAAAFGVWTLAVPVAAESAAGYAHRQWRAAQGQGAAYWFEVARRLEPRDWRYHWYAGQFWFAQAAQTGKPEAARLADQAFADGFAANPREVRNLLGRVATHMQLRTVLAAPADGPTLIDWSKRAVTLAPSDSAARMELALVLSQFGSSNGKALK
jgi:O-antigen ligase